MIDNNWIEVSYWHNKWLWTNEFETLTFSYHHHTSYSQIRTYSKWWSIDWWTGNVLSSYNNKTWNANWWNHWNSDDLICAGIR